MPLATISGFTAYIEGLGQSPVQLMQPKRIANAKWIHVPKYGSSSLLQPQNTHAERKVMTLNPVLEDNFTYRLNSALLGGESYPVLTAIMGAAAGYASAGAGLFFAAASTALDVAKTSQRILARSGDEIWQIEEIGKVRTGGKQMPVHVNSFWLVDPFRRQTIRKGWLIHEKRSELTLE